MVDRTPEEMDAVKPLLHDLYRGSDNAEGEWVNDVSCPKCGSDRVWRFKFKQLEQGYKCRDCGAWDFT